MTEDFNLNLVTYNIDGLPEKLDLNDLPWIFKPIVWIYKLFTKTTLVTINDNSNKKGDVENINRYLLNLGPDIIAVQEDFNYHNELTKDFQNKYNLGTFTGEFSLKKIFSITEIFNYFPLLRFRCDGLNLFTNKDKIVVNNEQIIPWKKCYGYVGHANDLLTHKGFRYYNLQINNKYKIDLYIVHMDADFYNPDEDYSHILEDIEAREAQMNQLVNFIHKQDTSYPSIIVGDFNCSPDRVWDNDNIKLNLLAKISLNPFLHIEEVVPSNYKDIDRVFIINNDMCDYKLNSIGCYFDKDISYSDHKPLITEFTIKPQQTLN